MATKGTAWRCDNDGVSHMAALVYIPSHSLPSGSVKQPQHIMQPVPAGYPIAELSGPIIVGCLLNWGLFGTLSVQLYLYYLAFPNDRRFVKYLVYGIYVFEFVQTMLVTRRIFVTFGYGFGDMDALTRVDLYSLTVPILGAIVACVGQVFYAYRIFIVSKSRIIPILVICVSFTGSVAAVIFSIYTFQAGYLTEMDTRKMQITAGISCGATALCDILIAICMTYYLMRSTTNFRRTRMLVMKIIRLTIETGSITAVAVLLDVVLFIVVPYQTSYLVLGRLVPKLYANSIYMVLNSRFQIIGGRDTYKSSTDTSITTTMIRDIISQSVEETQYADGTHAQVPVVIISSEVSNDDHEMDQVNDKPRDACMSLPA
ncbi:hypothetical protein ARMGADRAFT_968819 [Armillaria gallica]|uniref:DUF6534 domain-containing protein n=1 Tax=Armillaria gallica TaxID=47427 RepID=A0A2H3DS77_ARMGA|nr:hypothetical protein ARMGADRAFT_968819 [Armillaria gallica]